MASTDEQIPEIILRTRAAASGVPGEQVEPRQTVGSFAWLKQRSIVHMRSCIIYRVECLVRQDYQS